MEKDTVILESNKQTKAQLLATLDLLDEQYNLLKMHETSLIARAFEITKYLSEHSKNLSVNFFHQFAIMEEFKDQRSQEKRKHEIDALKSDRKEILNIKESLFELYVGEMEDGGLGEAGQCQENHGNSSTQSTIYQVQEQMDCEKNELEEEENSFFESSAITHLEFYQFDESQQIEKQGMATHWFREFKRKTPSGT
jgi:hypothetical protein